MQPLLVFGIAPLAGVVAGLLANAAADNLPQRRPAQAQPGPVQAPQSKWAWRAPAVVVALALLFPLLAWLRDGVLSLLLVDWCYAWFLITVLVIDLETRRVLNVMVGPAALFALAAGLWLGEPSLPSILAGGLVAFLLFWGLYVIGRLMFGAGALGFGDVKLAGVIGIMTGYPQVLLALVLGAGLGAVGAIILLITRRAGWRSTCAYAPYLAIGAMLALWAGIGGA